MTFQHNRQRRYVTAETGEEMHAIQDHRKSKKRKVPDTGQSAGFTGYCTTGGVVWESEVRRFEKEAYISVLRAFRSQSDSISWDKESLITNLRKELRLSNDEHLDTLRRISNENCSKFTGCWELHQPCGDHYGVIGPRKMTFDTIPHNIAKAPQHEKDKKRSAIPRQSFDVSSTFYRQSSLIEGRKVLMVKKRSNVSNGLNNLLQNPSSGPNEMNNTAFNVPSKVFTNKSSELAKHNCLLGKKVKTRLPPYDHNFYNAVINRYDSARIPPGDIQLDDDDPEMTTLPHCFGPRGTNTPLATEIYSIDPGRGIRIRKSRPKLKVSCGSGLDALEFKIRRTDDLLETVKSNDSVTRVLNAGNVDLYTFGDAKGVLKEHEKVLIQVLESLADVSDDE